MKPIMFSAIAFFFFAAIALVGCKKEVEQPDTVTSLENTLGKYQKDIVIYDANHENQALVQFSTDNEMLFEKMTKEGLFLETINDIPSMNALTDENNTSTNVVQNELPVPNDFIITVKNVKLQVNVKGYSIKFTNDNISNQRAVCPTGLVYNAVCPKILASNSTSNTVRINFYSGPLTSRTYRGYKNLCSTSSACSQSSYLYNSRVYTPLYGSGYQVTCPSNNNFSAIFLN